MAEEQKKKKFSVVRILGTDINGELSLLYGLAKIKGVSVMFSNAICQVLGLDRNRKVSSLSEKEIESVENFLNNPKKEGIPVWMLNQRKDLAQGTDSHLNGKDLDFNLIQLKRRLAKIKTYKGLRHKLGLPVRGQRTATHFRKSVVKKKRKGGGNK